LKIRNSNIIVTETGADKDFIENGDYQILKIMIELSANEYYPKMTKSSPQ